MFGDDETLLTWFGGVFFFFNKLVLLRRAVKVVPVIDQLDCVSCLYNCTFEALDFKQRFCMRE